MLKTILRYTFIDLGRNKYRFLLMVLAVVGALTTYTLLGLLFEDISNRAMVQWRGEWPFDISLRGANVVSLENQVRKIQGVVHVEEARLVDVVLGTGQTRMVTISSSSLVKLECSAGEPPRDAEEVALPKSFATALQVDVGDTITVIPFGTTSAVALRVSGILADKAGVAPMPVLTKEGSERITRDLGSEALLINLDGRVDIEKTRDTIAALAPQAEVRIRDLQYSGVQQGKGLSEMVVGAVRLLVLCVTLSALTALFYLMQRERAYQLGVFRAMGLKRLWLLVPPLMEGLLVMLCGLIVSAGLVYPAAGLLGVMSPLGQLLQELMVQTTQFTLISLGLTLAMTLILAHKPITTLLQDPWGKG